MPRLELHEFHRLPGPDLARQFITTNAWPDFAEKQIKLLVEAGIPERVAKSYYENLPE